MLPVVMSLKSNVPFNTICFQAKLRLRFLLVWAERLENEWLRDWATSCSRIFKNFDHLEWTKNLFPGAKWLRAYKWWLDCSEQISSYSIENIYRLSWRIKKPDLEAMNDHLVRVCWHLGPICVILKDGESSRCPLKHPKERTDLLMSAVICIFSPSQVKWVSKESKPSARKVGNLVLAEV